MWHRDREESKRKQSAVLLLTQAVNLPGGVCQDTPSCCCSWQQAHRAVHALYVHSKYLGHPKYMKHFFSYHRGEMHQISQSSRLSEVSTPNKAILLIYLNYQFIPCQRIGKRAGPTALTASGSSIVRPKWIDLVSEVREGLWAVSKDGFVLSNYDPMLN